MKKRLAYLSSCLALLVVAAFSGASFSASPASAQVQEACPDGSGRTVSVPPGTDPAIVQQLCAQLAPAVPAPEAPTPTQPSPPPAAPKQPAPPSTTPTTPTQPRPAPNRGGGDDEGSARGDRGGDRERRSQRRRRDRDGGEVVGRSPVERQRQTRVRPGRPGPMRNSDGSPAPGNPGAVTALPGAASPFTTGVPNFVIEKFRVPVFLLPIYQAAGIEYGIRWEILAAINEIETDYGRNLNVSTAGALGWMQFMPASWRAYGVDANKDGKKDPYNPVDAIFAAARYLKAANYENDVREAIFAYNHANWYVDSVLLRAKLIAGVPADLVGSLTGLTEGRFPIAAKARYADDLQEARSKRVQAGENAANVIESDANRRSVEIYAKNNSPAVATNDGRIKKIDRKNGRIVLQDVYGNTYTYNGLRTVARFHPVPKSDAQRQPGLQASALAAGDREPAAPASAGRQPVTRKGARGERSGRSARRARRSPSAASHPRTPVKQRLFANPDMPQVRESGGMAQLVAMDALGEDAQVTYRSRFAPPVKLDPDRFVARPLRRGSQVTAGTVLGRVGARDPGKAAHLEFSIRPAGKGAPTIDPKPILDGWKLLEATAIYRTSGRNVLRGGGATVGQVLLMPKAMLERRVLADERIEIYDGGRSDIRSGRIDRRVLASLAYLSESGMRPTVSSLRSGRSTIFTASGNLSAHPSGNAVDIAAINGTPILGNQEPGGMTDQAVRRLMLLQGTMRPDQIISLLDLGSNTVAMGDHADHIHLGFQPHFGDNQKLGRQAQAVLKPGQWPELLQRLEEIDNPVVPTRPSPYAIPAG
jgi:hypothetical protein